MNLKSKSREFPVFSSWPLPSLQLQVLILGIPTSSTRSGRGKTSWNFSFSTFGQCFQLFPGSPSSKGAANNPLVPHYPATKFPLFPAFSPTLQGHGEGEEEEAANSTWEVRAGFGMKISPKKGIKLEFLVQVFPKNSLE